MTNVLFGCNTNLSEDTALTIMPNSQKIECKEDTQIISEPIVKNKFYLDTLLFGYQCAEDVEFYLNNSNNYALSKCENKFVQFDIFNASFQVISNQLLPFEDYDSCKKVINLIEVINNESFYYDSIIPQGSLSQTICEKVYDFNNLKIVSTQDKYAKEYLLKVEYLDNEFEFVKKVDNEAIINSLDFKVLKNANSNSKYLFLFTKIVGGGPCDYFVEVDLFSIYGTL